MIGSDQPLGRPLSVLKPWSEVQAKQSQEGSLRRNFAERFPLHLRTGSSVASSDTRASDSLPICQLILGQKSDVCLIK